MPLKEKNTTFMASKFAEVIAFCPVKFAIWNKWKVAKTAASGTDQATNPSHKRPVCAQKWAGI
jgi:hypothetical protein